MLCDKCNSYMVVTTTSSSGSDHGMFYDDDGRKHYHNANTTITKVVCEDCGHTTRNRVFHSCWCGWSQTDTTLNEPEDVE